MYLISEKIELLTTSRGFTQFSWHDFQTKCDKIIFKTLKIFKNLKKTRGNFVQEVYLLNLKCLKCNVVLRPKH